MGDVICAWVGEISLLEASLRKDTNAWQYKDPTATNHAPILNTPKPNGGFPIRRG